MGATAGVTAKVMGPIRVGDSILLDEENKRRSLIKVILE